jgi:hypothetical protein
MKLFSLVKSGDIVPIFDEKDNVVGFSHLPKSPIRGIKTKIINNVTFRGDTEEQLNEDMENYEWMKTEFIDVFSHDAVINVLNLCFKLVNADITPDTIFLNKFGAVYFIVAKDRKLYDDKYNAICMINDDEIDTSTSNKVIINMLLLKFETLE